MRKNPNDGLIVSEADAHESSLGGAATLVALLGAAIGAAGYWAELGRTSAWIALGVGAFACGIALVRLALGRLREIDGVLSALGGLLLGGAAIAGAFIPIAPTIGIGVWLAAWLGIGLLEE